MAENANINDIEAKANQIREEIAQAKADHISADSAEADKIRKDVADVKAEADRLSPQAFSDLEAVDSHRLA